VAGKYLLRAWVKIDLSGATFAATRTLTIKLRRLNNTAADVANAVLTFTVPITTTLSETLAFIDLPGVQYTGTATDQIAMFADINIVPSAGSIVISAGGITAMRI
jgi:HAMP domain-containing protein